MQYISKEHLVIEFKKLLLEKQISQREVAQKLNITPQALTKIINKQNFSFDDMEKLLTAINYRMDVDFVPAISTKGMTEEFPLSNNPLEKSPTPSTVTEDNPNPSTTNPPPKASKPLRKLTDEDRKAIDLSRLPTDIKYQLGIRELYGSGVLAELMEEARNEDSEKEEEN